MTQLKSFWQSLRTALNTPESMAYACRKVSCGKILGSAALALTLSASTCSQPNDCHFDGYKFHGTTEDAEFHAVCDEIHGTPNYLDFGADCNSGLEEGCQK